MADLILPLKAEYFDAIKAGDKLEEYRLATPYWERRLVSGGVAKVFDRIILTKGYPARDDHGRRLVRGWDGWRRRLITHPHFGPDAVEVFAIDVSHPA